MKELLQRDVKLTSVRTWNVKNGQKYLKENQRSVANEQGRACKEGKCFTHHHLPNREGPALPNGYSTENTFGTRAEAC